jgi:hypothetical protein
VVLGAIVMAAFSLDLFGSGMGAELGSSGFDRIATLLLPAVTEATGFSIVSFIIIAIVTFTGTKAISSALGGEYILYGISRFM